MKQLQKALLLLSMAITMAAQAQVKTTGQAEAKMNSFISALMQKMTIDEKIGQLNLPSIGFDVTGPILSKDVESKIRNGQVGGVFNTFTPNAVRKLQDIAVKETRLKIPLLFGYDVIHGHKTIFPIALGLSCTWDSVLIEKSARVAAREATADGLNWTFSPMVDIARDPRWGRVSEGAGEDYWLGSIVARSMVRGYQGNNNDLRKDDAIMACVKHFALYGAAEAGRDYNIVDISPLKMYQYYLPPYKAAIDAGAGSVMSSFNEINGVPATANKWLMTDLLRRQWGFKGLVVTDYTAVSELINHGIGKDLYEVSGQALAAGIDMDMVSEGFLQHLKKLLQNGKVTRQQIDNACRRILEAKYKLGLFDDPYRHLSQERATTEILSNDNREAAFNIARHSMVLLKNDKQTLPLKAGATIALIGPLADDQRDMIGSWSAAGDWTKTTTIRAAMTENAHGTNGRILYAKGANITDDKDLIKQLNQHDGRITTDSLSPQQLIEQAVQTTRLADVVVAVLGESQGMTGEAACRSNIGLPGNQQELLKALAATGKPIVLVLMNGRPLTLEWEDAHVQSILEAWFPGSEGGHAITSVLTGGYNPSGKLTMTFPRNVGQIPIYYSAKNTGRPMDPNNKYSSKYLDVPNTPLYPFGFGLSYTSFKYNAPRLSQSSYAPGDKIQVMVHVSNTGDYDGEETAQLYVRDMVSAITQPLKVLRGLQKVYLKKGESREISFFLTVDDLKFYNASLQRVYEPGEFKVFVGGSSQDVQEASFTLTK